MNSSSPHTVDVFPITTSAFGMRSDWFESFAPRLVHPAYVLMALLLVISVGIMVLKRFEHTNVVKKLWNLPIIIVAAASWPVLVLGLKGIVDSFNTFLVQDIFQIPWQGFGFPFDDSLKGVVSWPAEGLARLLPNLAYWVIYAFYIIFFFFLAVLGPLVLAKGILFDEVEAFLQLLKELVTLFMWQTTVVVLVAFILPDIVSGKPFPQNPKANFYLLSMILGVMIFFTPSMTRKFGNHLGSSFFPPGFRWGGAMLGLSIAGKVGSMGASLGGATSQWVSRIWPVWKHRILEVEEFKGRYQHVRHIEELERERDDLEHEFIGSDVGKGGGSEGDKMLGIFTARGRTRSKSKIDMHRDQVIQMAKAAKKEFSGENRLE